MTNALREILAFVEDHQMMEDDIEYVAVCKEHSPWFHGLWPQVKESLDFEYDAGYGGQELFGVIWFKNGLWAERAEYDGSEWWEIRRKPTIEEILHS